MSFSLAFWIVFLMSCVLGTWGFWPLTRRDGAWFLALILIFLLGLSAYGTPLHR